MKLKMKTTATLLIAIFMISTIAVAIPVSAQNTWTVPGDFDTIQEAIDSASVLDGDTILVGPGNWDGATVDKDVEIRGEPGAVIDDGPSHGSWTCGFKLISGSSGTTISYFTFEALGLPIYGLGVDDVTIEHNKIYDTMQGITNWDGDNWVIRHNVIRGIAILFNSGGLGIVVGSRNSPVSGNVVAYNKIFAEIPDDHTFSVGGILLCTDERYGWNPGVVTDNKIIHNRVKVTGPKSWSIALQVIGLSDYNPVPPDEIVYAKTMLYDNLVGFNVLRGSDLFVECLPTELEEVNTIGFNVPGRVRGRPEISPTVFNSVV